MDEPYSHHHLENQSDNDNTYKSVINLNKNFGTKLHGLLIQGK